MFLVLGWLRKENGAGGCLGIFCGVEKVRGLVLLMDIVDRGRIFSVCVGVPERVCSNSVSE